MKKDKKITLIICFSTVVFISLLTGCVKYQNGFLSPYVQYAVSDFSIIRGRVSSSYSMITDGSSIPLHVKLVHVYDSTGKIADDIFTKKYLVTVWTAAYNPLTDKTFAAISAKRTTDSLPPVVINESNGTITSNSGSLNIPLGVYSMDLMVSNSAGSEKLEKIIHINVLDGAPLETAPQQGAFANGRALARQAKVTYFYNGANNPFVQYNINRYADTPNILTLKFVDRNGIPFNAKSGEIIKRPNTGLNPNPPFLQNLQDYAPDTYIATDTAISIKFPLAPFPINSLGNGYNMYYNINTSAVQIDSTSAWSSNTGGNFYHGTSDSHYLGTYVNGEYDYSIRVPMRIFVPGAYEFIVKILNVEHR